MLACSRQPLGHPELWNPAGVTGPGPQQMAVDDFDLGIESFAYRRHGGKLRHQTSSGNKP